jgi:thymidylate synthase
MRDIPVLSVMAGTLPEAWEKAVIGVWDNGIEIKTQYDKPEDSASRDATVMITVNDPFAEPRIHKNFPGGPEELESYRQEVVDGIHNHWIDPEAGKWTYTYNERLFEYDPVEDIRNSKSPKPFKPVDQIECLIDNLSKSPYSRRAQAITWMPTADPQTADPPCLQRIWARMVEDEGELYLNMNTHWRSRDLYKAWFMNAYALTDLQKNMAERISENVGQKVHVGRYVDISDSLHIYGSYIDGEDVAGEVEKMKGSSYLGRSWETTHPAFEMMTQEARELLSKNPDHYAKGDK